MFGDNRNDLCVGTGAGHLCVLGVPGKTGLFPSSGRAAFQSAYRAVPRPEGMHLDHVIPVAKWGSNHVTNVSPLPAAENLAKGAQIQVGSILWNAARVSVPAAVVVTGAVTGYEWLWVGNPFGEALVDGLKAGAWTLGTGVVLTIGFAVVPTVASLVSIGLVAYGAWQFIQWLISPTPEAPAQTA